MITRKILERSAPIFVNTLGTLGQHEFAYFVFCGSIVLTEVLWRRGSVIFERSCYDGVDLRVLLKCCVACIS